jgi:hypothetical protein
MTRQGEILRNGGKQERSIITGEGSLAINRTVLKVTEGRRTVPECGMERENGVKERHKERIPLDEYLKTDKLPFKMTEKMMKETAFMGQSQVSFKRAAEMAGKISGVKISAEMTREVTEYVGKLVFEKDRRKAEERDKNMSKTEYKREKEGVLYIMADGSMVNTRIKGKKGLYGRKTNWG